MAKDSKSQSKLQTAMREVHTREPSTVKRAKQFGPGGKEAMLRAVAFSKARGAGARLPKKAEGGALDTLKEFRGGPISRGSPISRPGTRSATLGRRTSGGFPPRLGVPARPMTEAMSRAQASKMGGYKHGGAVRKAVGGSVSASSGESGFHCPKERY